MNTEPPAAFSLPSRIIDPVSIMVSRPMVLLRLGYRRPSQVPSRSASRIEEVMERGCTMLAPRAVCARCTVRHPEEGTIEIDGVLRTSSRSLVERLHDCSEAVIFVATIGAEMEEWVAELSSTEKMTLSLIADAYASAAAIELGMVLETLLGEWLVEDGLVPGRRFAPGYGDWNLAAQTPLLRRLDAGRIGISLTEGDLMQPAKSISGVVGGRP